VISRVSPSIGPFPVPGGSVGMPCGSVGTLFQSLSMLCQREKSGAGFAAYPTITTREEVLQPGSLRFLDCGARRLEVRMCETLVSERIPRSSPRQPPQMQMRMRAFTEATTTTAPQQPTFVDLDASEFKSPPVENNHRQSLLRQAPLRQQRRYKPVSHLQAPRVRNVEV
jgi:hypothetical protein